MKKIFVIMLALLMVVSCVACGSEDSELASFEEFVAAYKTTVPVKVTVSTKLETVLGEMQEAVQPDRMYVHENIALVATVGHGMANNIGTSARLFTALSKANINVIMIDQGSSELNIIVGVDNKDCDECIRAIYREFFN